MPILAGTLKKILYLPKRQSYRAWNRALCMCLAATIVCPPAKPKLGFQSPAIAHVQMREHMLLVSGAGLGAET